MERYVDGYVLPVREDDLAAHQEMAAEAGKMWTKHGAFQYFEGVGEDLTPEMGDLGDVDPPMTFPNLIQYGPNETVVFAFAVYESREHRDEVNAKIREDPSMGEPDHGDDSMPFNVARMAYGGFASIVDYER